MENIAPFRKEQVDKVIARLREKLDRQEATAATSRVELDHWLAIRDQLVANKAATKAAK